MGLKLPWTAFDLKKSMVFGIQSDRVAFMRQQALQAGYVGLGGFANYMRQNPYLFVDKFYDPDKPVEEEKGRRPDLETAFRTSTLHSYPEALGDEARSNQNLIWRKKSKAGILYAVQNNITVHFILGETMCGFDAQNAVTKKTNTITTPDNPQGPSGSGYLEKPIYWTKERAITGAELRWIYRMRHDLKVQTYVQFWKWTHGGTFVQSPPPWDWGDAIGAAWALYTPALEGFYSYQL